MPTLALRARYDQQFVRLALLKATGQLRHGRGQNGWVVHGREHHTLSFGGNGGKAALQRAQLPAPVIRIQDERREIGAAQPGSDVLMIAAEDHDHRGARLSEREDQPVEEGFPGEVQEGFRPSHPPGLACRQNKPGKVHVPLGKMLLVSARQFDGAFRRTAIISATTATAISSGVTAPMSSPIGA